ncbi:MAG: Mur ligase family protein [Erysipelotrichales bacterium]
MKFNDLREVLAYIETRTNFELGLIRVNVFLEKAEIDYESLKYIHIGGTNGKGSTAFYISECLSASDYKVGMFSSPSIISHNDRIRINGEFISDKNIVDFINEYYDLIEETKLTMFEIDVVMALDYFIKNKVDIAIMEVGMGGEYDGTNIIDPLLSIITNVGLDHTKYLGDTKKDIALTKAGIIKENSLVLIGEKDTKIKEVIKSVALDKNAMVFEVGEPSIKSHLPIIFDYKQYKDIQLKALADYQIMNVSLVLDALDILNDYYGIEVKESTIYDILKTKSWLGRFELLSFDPLIIIDGAHNVEGVQQLCKSIDKFKDYHKSIMFAALEDKQTDEMVSMLASSADEMIISEFDFYRTKKAEDINKNFNYEIALDYQEYIKNKVNSMDKNDMFVITGSLYFISQVRKFVVDTLNL